MKMRCVAMLLVLPLVVGGCTTGGAGPSDDPSPDATASTEGFGLAGIWQDTDVVGTNSCGLELPAIGTSRVTEGIVIEQVDREITLTAPPNVLGTQTVATGTLADDGSMILSGEDSGTTITLNYRATSDDQIGGTSQVDTGTCVFEFSNTLVRTD